LRVNNPYGSLDRIRQSRRVVDQQTQRSLLQAWLHREYGLFIGSGTVAKLLGYRSAASLSKARCRGHVPLQMFSVPYRKGLYTSPAQLATYLQATLPPAHLPPEAAMDG
jgi:hypothetical protein